MAKPTESNRELTREQGIKKYVASQRVDLLALLQTITDCGPKGVIMDGFHFQKDQPMIVMAHTKNTDQIYDFREALSKHFDTVRLQNQTHDKAKKATKFTLTFDYTKTKKR